MDDSLYNGTIKFFNIKSRFGFITEEKTKMDHYFYIKNPAITFKAGDNVSFNLRHAKKGIEAVNIKMIDPVN